MRIRFENQKANSLTRAVLEQIKTAASSATETIVLESGGDGAFCAGASFDELKACSSLDDATSYFELLSETLLTLRNSPQLVIARVHGKVVGGGVGLVAVSDYAIATESASVRLSEASIGLAPNVIAPAVERKLGAASFSAMSIDAAWRSASWADQNGLYAKVVSTVSELDSAVDELERELCARTGNETLKRLLWAAERDWEDELSVNASQSAALVIAKNNKKLW